VRTKTLWIRDEYLQEILTGRKDIEVRVGYSNIVRLQVGDVLRLNDRYPYVITRIGQYGSHEELLEHEDPARIAPGVSRETLLAALRDIYPAKKEALGVIALEISRGEPTCSLPVGLFDTETRTWNNTNSNGSE